MRVACLAIVLDLLARPAVAQLGGVLPSVPAPSGLDPAIWATAEAAFHRANDAELVQRPFVAVVDYSRPSSERRLWVVNMRNGELFAHTHVAHGAASGDLLATRFSNRRDSHATSLGVFLTGRSYRGGKGLALRLHGLEAGINDHAYARGVVLHASRSVTPEFARARGRVGRSNGCLSVSEWEALRLVPVLAEGALLVAWAPEPRWLQTSAWVPDSLRRRGGG
ncbi:MAG: murein L,D-transpeptidase catalytic domain family protein [Gemmatimonadales bacterium]|nr:murein L,D-transpeptidase catalytic domain family protein [Gemmatimonadales bacterium]